MNMTGKLSNKEEIDILQNLQLFNTCFICFLLFILSTSFSKFFSAFSFSFSSSVELFI